MAGRIKDSVDLKHDRRISGARLGLHSPAEQFSLLPTSSAVPEAHLFAARIHATGSADKLEGSYNYFSIKEAHLCHN